MWLAAWSLALGAGDPDRNAMAQMLSLRDRAPCAQVEALSPTPILHLQALAQTLEQPPWAAVRAADCLVLGHAEAVEASLLEWVTSETQRGLGRLVLARLATLPKPLARRVAEAALTRGPEPERVRRRLQADPRPAIRALAERPVPVVDPPEPP